MQPSGIDSVMCLDGAGFNIMTSRDAANFNVPVGTGSTGLSLARTNFNETITPGRVKRAKHLRQPVRVVCQGQERGGPVAETLPHREPASTPLTGVKPGTDDASSRASGPWRHYQGTGGIVIRATSRRGLLADISNLTGSFRPGKTSLLEGWNLAKATLNSNLDYSRPWGLDRAPARAPRTTVGAECDVSTHVGSVAQLTEFVSNP